MTVLLATDAPAGAACPPPTAANLGAWHAKVAKVPRPSAQGCFTARYPRLVWQEAECTTPPAIPMTPRRPEVGSGNDISARAPSGFISDATGSFENVMNVTSESSPIGNSGPPVANAYTLQLNTNFFGTDACDGSPNPQCRGWEQFVFANDGAGGSAYIQYWLIRYNTSCPIGGWLQFTYSGDSDIYCWKNSPAAAAVPSQPITNLQNLRMSGNVSPGSDSVTLAVGQTAYSTPGSNAVNAAAGWNVAEFNVFGYGGDSSGGGMATFNSGASLDVRTTIDYGGTAAPICVPRGFTAETNNLDFGTPAPPATPPGPAIIFLQNTIGGAQTNCGAASVIGDTGVPRSVPRTTIQRGG